MKNVRYSIAWFAAWLCATLAIAGVIWVKFAKDEKAMFLPGETTHGHYQIEVRCDACHTPFGGVKQDACMACHGEELKRADDSHPKKKFDDPRNADRVAILDARECIACHVEHRPELTHTMGLTLPPDYCYRCHEDVGEDRPSHKDLAFNSCQTAGCHNYHDNRALYEDFLAKHLNEPENLDEGAVLVLAALTREEGRPAIEPDAPPTVQIDPEIGQAWATSAHATNEANCTACHVTQEEPSGPGNTWHDAVSLETCQSCHEKQAEGFLMGRHGMRLKEGLTPMTPALARLPMKPDAAHNNLTCNACHDAHDYNTRTAAVDACLKCHDDEHSRTYKRSTHFTLWEEELAGKGAPGSGVSCATCHLPRVEAADGAIYVEHNQNDNLRPNEKMLRGVCMNCHGLGFALDALADRDLIQQNFEGRPAEHIPSLDWVKLRSEGESR